MPIKIRESAIKIWSSQNQRQFGIDKPLKVEISSAAEETFLAMLELGVANGQFEVAADLAGLKIESAENLHAKLGFLTEDFKTPLARPELGNLPQPHGKYFQNRQQSVVLIPNLGRLGKLLIHALAHAGVGKIIVSDSTLVSETDCGRLGYSLNQIGQSKLSIIKSEIANTPTVVKLDNRMRWEDYVEVDIAVVETSGAFQPSDYQRWLSLSRKHIGVCFSDMHVLITAVIDEYQACLGCRELNKWDEDPQRKFVCAQIAGISGVKDSLSILFAASIVAQRIIKNLDTGVQEKDLQFWPSGGFLELVENINPGCGCQQAPGEI